MTAPERQKQSEREKALETLGYVADRLRTRHISRDTAEATKIAEALAALAAEFRALEERVEEAERKRDSWEKVAREYETALADRGAL